MRNFNPNNSFNLQANSLFGTICKIMRNKLFQLLLFLIGYNGTFAQSMSGEQQNIAVNEIRTFISKHKTPSATSSRSQILDAQNLEELTSRVQSSIYINNGQMSTYGQKPRNLFLDVISLNQIDNLVSSKNNIEIVIIKINSVAELNTKINLTSLSNFKKLKYVYIVSNVNVTAQDISKMIVNYDEKYCIFYKIEKGDSDQ